MTRNDIERYCEECDTKVAFMDGYDDCIEGLVERFGMEPVVCYDKAKIIAKLIRGGMSEEDALEWFNYNQIGAWIGNMTPCFIIKTYENLDSTETEQEELRGDCRGCGCGHPH